MSNGRGGDLPLAQGCDSGAGKAAASRSGYTLLELLVVLILMTLLLAVATPALKNALTADPLKKSAVQVAGLVRSARERAVREQQDYLLLFDFSENLVAARGDGERPGEEEDAEELSANQLRLPEEVSLLDFWSKGQGSFSDGVREIRVSRRGYMDEAVIHLRDASGTEVGLKFSPFLDAVDIVVGRIETK